MMRENKIKTANKELKIKWNKCSQGSAAKLECKYLQHTLKSLGDIISNATHRNDSA